jgi:hypothetical protein
VAAEIVVPTAVAEPAMSRLIELTSLQRSRKKNPRSQVLRSELEEHQALLKMRQQQLDEVAQIVS